MNNLEIDHRVIQDIQREPRRSLKSEPTGASLEVQRVRLCAPNAGDPCSILGWGTRSCMHAATKSLPAAIKRSSTLQLRPNAGASLVVQCLRICLLMQGTWVRALTQEDPTCHGATKPMCHNYWACVPQLLKPARLETVLHNKRSHRNEKPAHRNEE